MNNLYKNAQFMQEPQAIPVARVGWSWPGQVKRAANPGRLEKKFLNAMDHLFTVIILLSGEEEYETMFIGHIL